MDNYYRNKEKIDTSKDIMLQLNLLLNKVNDILTYENMEINSLQKLNESINNNIEYIQKMALE